MLKKTANTDHPIHELLAERWSPRAFLDRPVEEHKLLSLLEAARWAPSSYNEQPWRFLIARKSDTAEFEKMLDCLVEGNQAWAKGAPLLMLTLTSTKFSRNGRDNKACVHDIGLAIGNLTTQATAMGLVVHQMIGILPDKIREVYNIPPDFDPVTGAAIGYLGDPETLPENFRDAETKERTRKALREFVFQGKFGESASVVK